jgi:hypothetical protein
LKKKVAIVCSVGLAVLVIAVTVIGLLHGPLIITERAMLHYCLEPMENDEPLEVGSFTPLPIETALSMEDKSDGKVWVHKLYHATLFNLLTESGLRGCRVEYNIKRPFTTTEIAEAFEHWAIGAVKSGRYNELPICGDTDSSYMRVLESQFDRPNKSYLRVLFVVHDDLDYFFFVAAETPTKFTECDI